MGGKALLPQVPDLRRLNKRDYNTISREVIEKVSRVLDAYYGNLMTIPSYENKEEFGDLDLVISDTVLTPGWRDRVATALGSTAVHHDENSLVTSFEYKKFQVDIISSPRVTLDFACKYYSYNGMGNLLGRMARAMGYSLGHNGLFLRMKDDSDNVEKVLVTTDWYQALDLIGYRSYDFGYGIRRPENIYQYIARNDYFDKEIFLLENANSRDRYRDTNNPIYAGFLEYIKDPKVVERFDFSTATSTPWASALIRACPGIVTKYKERQEQNRINKLIKKKFNGDIVSEISGFKEKALGDFMGGYKASFKTKDDYEQFILSSSPETIAESIKKFQVTYTAPVLQPLEKKEEDPKSLEELLAKKPKSKKVTMLGEPF